MKFLILEKNLARFQHRMKDKIHSTPSGIPVKMESARVTIGNDEYIYVTNKRSLQGCRGVEVVFFTGWMDHRSNEEIDEIEILAEIARLK